MSPFRQGQEPHSLHGKGIFSSASRVGRALSAVGLEGLPLTGLFVIWYAIGLLLMVFWEVPEPLRFANGVFLCLYAVSLCELTARGLQLRGDAQERFAGTSIGWSRLLPPALGIAAGTFAVEWTGVHTGYPFGEYGYNSTLGMMLGGVPWTMGLAWVGVILNGVMLSSARSRLARAFETGVWVVLLDLVLDPVAEARGFWDWAGDGSYYGIRPLTLSAGSSLERCCRCCCLSGR